MSRISIATVTRGRAPSHSPPDMTFAPGGELAHRLGWFSIALGLTQLVAPRLVCRMTGIRNEELMQCCGLREIASGAAVLCCARPITGMWARVAGDVMDLAILTTAMVDNDEESQVRAMEAAAVVAGITAFDMWATVQLTAAKQLEG